MLPAFAWPVCKTRCSTWLAISGRAERDTLAVNLKESESEKAELVSALEQAKHTVRGVPGMRVLEACLGPTCVPALTAYLPHQLQQHGDLYLIMRSDYLVRNAGHPTGRCRQEAASRGYGLAEVRPEGTCLLWLATLSCWVLPAAFGCMLSACTRHSPALLISHRRRETEQALAAERAAAAAARADLERLAAEKAQLEQRMEAQVRFWAAWREQHCRVGTQQAMQSPAGPMHQCLRTASAHAISPANR